jgi:antitoxin (DNA-binding transcriptional repressor) of toxin-antitoxin stability system
MRVVDLKILANGLSEYVRLAAGGEVVVIMDRNRVLAEIVPPQTRLGVMTLNAELAELVGQGIVTPPTISPDVPLPAMKPVMSFDELMADLRKNRGDP